MAVEGLSIRLLLDRHMNARLAEDLRRDGQDVTLPRELGTESAPDEAHLVWATENARVVATFDRRDFPALARRWAARNHDHARIIVRINRQPISYGELLRRLRTFLDADSAEEMVNQVRWLDESCAREESYGIRAITVASASPGVETPG